tara:strand:- start:1155 stop:1811 length:657 start_codon:yes stop_codon:yes gene_type:complete
MAQIIRLRRSTTQGSKPTTSDITTGELAINVNDGKVFLRKSGSAVGDNIKEFVTLDHSGTLSGSLNITGSITASAFKGDGSGLSNITAEISENATVTASFSNTDTINVTHNFNSKNIMVSVYDSSDSMIIPSEVNLTSPNVAQVVLSTNDSGFIVVAKGGHIVSGSVDANQITNLDDLVVNEVNELGVFSGSAQVSLSGDVTGTAAATVISQVDGETF